MYRFLFKLCAQLLICWGRIFHFSYEKISVIVNIYLQGTLLMLSGLLPAIASAVVAISNPSLLHIVICVPMMIYSSIYGAGCYLLIKHYPPQWEDSFDLCVNDLLRIGDCLHVSYVVLNLLIFVVWWLTMIFVNLLLSYFILF